MLFDLEVLSSFSVEFVGFCQYFCTSYQVKLFSVFVKIMLSFPLYVYLNPALYLLSSLFDL